MIRMRAFSLCLCPAAPPASRRPGSPASREKESAKGCAGCSSPLSSVSEPLVSPLAPRAMTAFTQAIISAGIFRRSVSLARATARATFLESRRHWNSSRLNTCTPPSTTASQPRARESPLSGCVVAAKLFSSPGTRTSPSNTESGITWPSTAVRFYTALCLAVSCLFEVTERTDPRARATAAS